MFRRQFIIDGPFQFALMFRAGCYSATMLLVLCAGVFQPMLRQIDAGDEGAAMVMLYLHEHFWPVAILCVILAMAMTVQISHRIAGPLYRLKRTLGTLGDGVIPGRVATRKLDFLKNEVAIINNTIASIAVATDEIKAAEYDVSVAIDECENLARDAGTEDLRKALSMLRGKELLLREKVHFFQREEHVSASGSNKFPTHVETPREKPVHV